MDFEAKKNKKDATKSIPGFCISNILCILVNKSQIIKSLSKRNLLCNVILAL